MNNEGRKIWVLRDSQTLGPYSEDEVRGYLNSGQLDRGDSASWEGDVAWSSIEKILRLPPKTRNPATRKDAAFASALKVPVCGGLWVGLSTLALMALLAFFMMNSSPISVLLSLGFVLLIGNIVIIILWQRSIKLKAKLKAKLQDRLIQKLGSPTALLSFLAKFAENYGDELMAESISNLDPMGFAKGFLTTKLGKLFIDDQNEAENAELAAKILRIDQAIEKTGRSYAKSTMITFIGVLALIKPFKEYLDESHSIESTSISSFEKTFQGQFAGKAGE